MTEGDDLPVAGGADPVGADPAGVDRLAAALRADRADLEVYERVLVGSLAEALPEGVIEVTRERSLGDRMAGRPGKVRSLRALLGDHQLELATGRHGLEATVTRQVRGVAISRRQVSLEEWTQLLAEQLTAFAERSTATREALERLLGAGGPA